jgi:hypothetical protein
VVVVVGVMEGVGVALVVGVGVTVYSPAVPQNVFAPVLTSETPSCVFAYTRTFMNPTRRTDRREETNERADERTDGRVSTKE